MNIFSNLKVYAGKWSVKESRSFTAEEISSVEEACVVPSKYGSSVQFRMQNGGLTYIPLEQSSSVGIGETIDLTKAKVLTLEKSGESDIYRVSID